MPLIYGKAQVENPEPITKMPFSKWMDKWTIVHSNKETHAKKKWAIKSCKDMEKLKWTLLSDISYSKKLPFYIHAWHSGKDKTMQTVQDG